MRARNIKPGFFKNDRLAELPPFARLLFIGLWMMADREGRLEDRPKRIHGEILPFDDLNIEKELEMLANGKDPFIVRYEVDGEKYIQIVNFSKHQNPHKRETPSAIPAVPTKGRPRHDLGTDKAGPRHGRGTTKTGTGPAESPFSESPFSDSLNPHSLNPESSTRPGPIKAGTEVSFEDVWEAYPRKADKPDALKAFRKLVDLGEDLALVLAAVEAYAAHCRREATPDKFIKHGSTFLREERWKEWVPAPPPASTSAYPEHSPTEIVANPGDPLVDPDKARAIVEEYVRTALSR